MNKMLILAISCIFIASMTIMSANATSAKTNVLTKGLVITVRTNSSIGFGYDSIGQISCARGETLTGGGYKTSFKDGLSVYQNGPSYDGTKWLVSARYTPGSASSGVHRGPAPPLEIYGMCMKFVP